MANAASLPHENDEGTVAGGVTEPPWRFRGTDLSRILALSDGIFAFALTLLVLGLVIPASVTGSGVFGYLTSDVFGRPLLAYLVTFFVISLWWQGHHLIFTYLRRYNRNLVRLNTLFLLFIAILPFSTGLLNAARGDPVGVAVFSLLQIAAGLSLGGLWVYASGVGGLTPADFPRDWRDYVTRATLLPPLIFAVSIPVAFVNTILAQLLWLLIAVMPLVLRRRLGSGN
ncbi:MAG TPA: TMEM175 family protein [Thermoplasmata archaeon]|nr:TMEM175 family protein [Thermoplasmata archaeon]